MPPGGRKAATPELRGEGPARHLRVATLTGIPGLLHAFTVRGADPPTVARDASGRPMPLWSLRQVHGPDVVVVDGADASPPLEAPTGDALVTRRRGAALAVRVADCVPILLADPRSGVIAAVHAGWRGTVAGVLRAAVRTMLMQGARAQDIRVAMGPAIGACCFEVGSEVVDALLRSDPGAGGAILDGPRPRVDLLLANRRQALDCGLPPEGIGAAGLCTACRPDLLESHRRTGGSPGRMAGIIGWLD